MIYLGTSGFSYDDWVGSFYPVGMPKREWLTYYARELNACEINSILTITGVRRQLAPFANCR